jgi:hypothetical protein
MLLAYVPQHSQPMTRNVSQVEDLMKHNEALSSQAHEFQQKHAPPAPSHLRVFNRRAGTNKSPQR